MKQYKNMGEKYAEMGANADGMKTSSEATSEIVEAWKELRKDTISWFWATSDGKTYPILAKGNGLEEMIGATNLESIHFGVSKGKKKNKNCLAFYLITFILYIMAKKKQAID